jgi:aspartyl-tRNA(Asn)/glutamyl-tRNA(Gln) amidotransferase subunit A
LNKGDLPFLSISELSYYIYKKDVSPVEVVEAHLDRIDKLDSKLHAFITVCREDALKAARKAEEDISRGIYKGPIHGIPLGAKDQWWAKGVLTTCGSTILNNFVPNEDATVIDKLKEAGGILLGKTNMTEFAMGYTQHYPYGTPRNPWNLDHMPGGSSAGSGSAPAAFLCPAALGEDTAGSIRGPASYCGIVGLRPSVGRVSRYGLIGSSYSMDVIGPLARTVKDTALVLEAIAGHDPKDKYTWKAPVPTYSSMLDGNINGQRIGIITDMMDAPSLEPEVRAAVRTAATVLEEIGAKVSEVSFPFISNAGSIASPIYMVEGAANQWDNLTKRPDEYERNMRLTYFTSALIPAQTYYKAQRLRELFRVGFLKLFEKYDAILYPTQPTPAMKIIETGGFGTKDSVLADLRGRRAFGNAANLVGSPSLSVPCGFSKSMLPIGMQLIGKPMEEETILKIGHAYEKATEWHTMRPNL